MALKGLSLWENKGIIFYNFTRKTKVLSYKLSRLLVNLKTNNWIYLSL